jgi:hypothetical protein
MAITGIPIPETQCIGDSLQTLNDAFENLDTRVTAASAAAVTAANSGVTKLIAGTNITLSPTGGTGQVTVNAQGGASVTVSDTPPSGASAGDLWFDSSSGITSVYYDSSWIDVGGGDSGTSAGSVNGIVKSDGSGNFSAAAAGTDYLTSATLGSSPATANAWVNFNGTLATPITPRASLNVSSVTKNGTGIWTVNFATPMVDANYCAQVTIATEAGNFGQGWGSVATSTTIPYSTAVTSTSLRVMCYGDNSGYLDATGVFVAIFGN